ASDRAAAEHLDYRNKNSEFLEGAKEKLGQTQQELKQLEQVEIATLETQKRSLEGFLEKETPFIVTKVKQPDSIRLKGCEDKIRDINDQLTQMRVVQGLTEEHPKVKAAVELLKQNEDEKAKLLAEAPLVEQ